MQNSVTHSSVTMMWELCSGLHLCPKTRCEHRHASLFDSYLHRNYELSSDFWRNQTFLFLFFFTFAPILPCLFIYLFILLSFIFIPANCQHPEHLLPILLRFVPGYEGSSFSLSLPQWLCQPREQGHYKFQGLTQGSCNWIKKFPFFSAAITQSECS